jgi:SAM-dependent methyltransferase
MWLRADTGGGSGVATGAVRVLRHAVRWSLDRAVSVGYGVLYDIIFDRFAPYRALQEEVLACVRAGVGPGVEPRHVRVLEVGCGPGNFACLLAEAGFAVLGLDPYGGLIELAREKRRARHLSLLAFQQGDLTDGRHAWEAAFDQVVSIHTLYAHPAPQRLLAEMWRVLKPGGYLVLVNHTRRLGPAATFADVRRQAGGLAALHALLWLVPNALFEFGRQRVGPHYWDEARLRAALEAAGFAVLELRRTFLNATSLLAWARKPGG